MSRIVQKFGGTSVANLDRIKNVAKAVVDTRLSSNNDVVVVVSAMAGVTNKFADYVSSLGVGEGHPEYDTVVSSGELVTAGLTSIAIENAGIKSRSYASWQVPIVTDSNHGRAVIQKVDPSNIIRDLSEGIIPVVCGFQGISNEQSRTTTLGRGGSDLTAVALASAIEADICEIYSDVDGVYTVDPNLYPGAQRIDQMSYAEMLEMAAQGAKVLQEQSVRHAMEKNVVIRVASSFIKTPGTIISSEVSKKTFCGMAITPAISQLLLTPSEELQTSSYLPSHTMISQLASDSLDEKADLISSTLTNNISEKERSNNYSEKFTDLIRLLLKQNFIQSDFLHLKGRTTLLLNKHQAPLAIKLLRSSNLVTEVRYRFSRKPLSKISVVGNDLDLNVAQNLVAELKQNHVESFIGTISEHKINLIITSEHLLDSISILHKYCGLDK